MQSAEAFKGAHKGCKIVVVGNAPSLREVDTALLSIYPTIGCNRVLEHPKFRPTYIMCADRRVYKAEAQRYEARCRDVSVLLSSTLFDLRVQCYGEAPAESAKFPYFEWRVGASSTPFNWTTFKQPLCSFASITGPMIQAAVIMGASEIGVVGVDMQTPPTGQSIHFYEAEGKWEGYHSNPNWKSGQQIVGDPTLRQYRRAFDDLARMGIPVVNLSPWKDTVFSRAFPPRRMEEF